MFLKTLIPPPNDSKKFHTPAKNHPPWYPGLKMTTPLFMETGAKFVKGSKLILGNNVASSLMEHSNNIFGNKGDFGNLSRKHGNTDP